MARAASPALARAASRAFLRRDGGVLHALRAEIDHELSSRPSPPARAARPGPFAVAWDGAGARDVVLRRKIGLAAAGGEEDAEVVVSALLGPLVHEEGGVLPGNVFMKVCVRKKGLNSLLLFDCEVREGKANAASGFAIRRLSCLSSSGNAPADRLLRCGIRGKLHGALKEYLKTKGISVELTDYVIQHLREKEKDQYLNWLWKVESVIS